jgi:hypothetical protein
MELTPLLLRPIAPIMDDGLCMMWSSRWKTGRENRSNRRKLAAVPHCPSQVPHDLSHARTRVVGMIILSIIAWVRGRPLIQLHLPLINLLLMSHHDLTDRTRQDIDSVSMTSRTRDVACVLGHKTHLSPLQLLSSDTVKNWNTEMWSNGIVTLSWHARRVSPLWVWGVCSPSCRAEGPFLQCRASTESHLSSEQHEQGDCKQSFVVCRNGLQV